MDAFIDAWFSVETPSGYEIYLVPLGFRHWRTTALAINNVVA